MMPPSRRARVNDDLPELCRRVELPEIPEMDEEAAEVEIDDDATAATTEWDLVEESIRLKARKKY